MFSLNSLRMTELSRSHTKLSRSMTDEYKEHDFFRRYDERKSQGDFFMTSLDLSYNSAMKKGKTTGFTRSLFSGKRRRIQGELTQGEDRVIHFRTVTCNMELNFDPNDSISERFAKRWS